MTTYTEIQRNAIVDDGAVPFVSPQIGVDPTLPQHLATKGWVEAISPGGGDDIVVNASPATDADFNDTSPAAPGGDLNVKWQITGTSPSSLSCYVDVSALEPLISFTNIADTSSVVLADGSVAFIAAQSGVTPTLDAHLGTKGYIDGLSYVTTIDATELVVGRLWDFAADLKVDVMSESTTGAGITAEGVLFKDGLVDGVDLQQIVGLFNGAVVETIDIDITEAAGTVSLELQQDGGGDLTFYFGGATYTLDCTPAETVALTAGTDTAPTQNYVYVTESGGTLTLAKSTTGWPATSHAPIATVVVQSAASLATDGAYKVHAWTDHIAKSTENGHLSHLNKKIRGLQANWIDGVTPADLSTSDPDAYLSTTSGNVFQLHPHAMPAWDMSGGEPLFVINDPTTSFLRVTSFAGITQDADGTTITANRYVVVVLWGVISEKSGDCQFYLNLPAGIYNIQAQAVADTDTTAVYTIPADYVGCGFLVARYVLKKTASGWTQSDKTSLLGQIPSSSVGGSGSTDTSVFALIDGTRDFTGIQAFAAGLSVPDGSLSGIGFRAGNSADLQAYHTGTVSVLHNATGALYIWQAAAQPLYFYTSNILRGQFTAAGDMSLLNHLFVAIGKAVYTDNVRERTSGVGVDVDGVECKDGRVDGVDVGDIGAHADLYGENLSAGITSVVLSMNGGEHDTDEPGVPVAQAMRMAEVAVSFMSDGTPPSGDWTLTLSKRTGAGGFIQVATFAVTTS